MLRLFFKETVRNKWNIIRIFLIVPFVQVLPVITLSNYVLSSYDQDLLMALLIWGGFYPTFFEIINTRMARFNTEKIQEVLISKRSIFIYNFIEIIAINLLFLPSNLVTNCGIAFLMNIPIDFSIVLVSIPFVFLNNLVCGTFLISLQILFKRYFNKVNLGMDILYLLTGAVIPLSYYPNWLRLICRIFPITNLISFVQTKDLFYLELFLILLFIFYLFGQYVLTRSIKIFRQKGGSQ